MNTSTIDQQELITAIKTNDQSVLRQLYLDNFSKVEHFILKNNGSKPEAKDIYQEAFIVLWNCIKDGKFISMGGTSLNGFLYQIARNKWIDHLRSERYRRTVQIPEKMEIEAFEEEPNNDEDLDTIARIFKNLKEDCKNLLTQFYFQKKSLNEIAKTLELDPASVRNKKYRCMQRLRAQAIDEKI